MYIMECVNARLTNIYNGMCECTSDLYIMGCVNVRQTNIYNGMCERTSD